MKKRCKKLFLYRFCVQLQNACKTLRHLQKNVEMGSPLRVIFVFLSKSMKKIAFHPENFLTIKNHLERGFPAIFPTDTSYGFSGDIFSARAVLSTEKIKERKEKPFLLLVSSFDEMQKWGKTDFLTAQMQEMATGKPVSFLLPKTAAIPENFFPETSEIGLRVPLFMPLVGFLSFYQKPIFSTSANKTGCPPLYRIFDIEKIFGDVENLLLVDAGDLEEKSVSSLIRPVFDGYEILRS